MRVLSHAFEKRTRTTITIDKSCRNDLPLANDVKIWYLSSSRHDDDKNGIYFKKERVFDLVWTFCLIFLTLGLLMVE